MRSERLDPDPRAPSDARTPAGGAAGVVIPLRSFATGKARLADVLDDAARIALVRTMADRVVDAAGDLPVCVVTSDPDVVAWCAARDLGCVPDPGSLDAAAAAGCTWAREHGLARAVVVHADLPHARTLATVAIGGDAPIATIVPDRHDDGTPVLAVPLTAGFRFSYGPGSFRRHVAEARRCGLDVDIVRDATLAFDVDDPADLDLLAPAGDDDGSPARPCAAR